jgi:hypothetical protein
MPSLDQVSRGTPEGWEPVGQTSTPPPPVGPKVLEPGFPVNMRCPVPPTAFTPDSSRQFYRGATIPQFRAFSPAPLSSNNNSSGSTTTQNITNTSSTTTTVSLKAQTASLTTPVLNPGNTYLGTATLSKTFNLLSVTASNSARVRVYATQSQQIVDNSRGSNTAPPFEVTQGLIADISLDTSPYMWLCTWLPNGANGDSPRTASVYVTVDNIGSMSTAITASLLFLPLET